MSDPARLARDAAALAMSEVTARAIPRLPPSWRMASARALGTLRAAVSRGARRLVVEELERCFRVYYSTKRGGSGLGLPTVARVMEEHGGSVSVVSEPGRGTSFTLRLPLLVELPGKARTIPVAARELDCGDGRDDTGGAGGADHTGYAPGAEDADSSGADEAAAADD